MVLFAFASTPSKQFWDPPPVKKREEYIYTGAFKTIRLAASAAGQQSFLLLT